MLKFQPKTITLKPTKAKSQAVDSSDEDVEEGLGKYEKSTSKAKTKPSGTVYLLTTLNSMNDVN